MPAPAAVLELCERFRLHGDDYRTGTFNETQLRRDFLDPLFVALGWDIDNTSGHAEAYRDVIHEDAVRVGGATKSPDYGFRVGGVRKFFVEAKKPSINLKTDPEPAYQLRRYGWSAKLPLSILSNFEELAVYDCRVRPEKTDKAAVARIAFYRYEEYADRWDELAGSFSKQAVWNGSFDKFAESNKKKRGTAEVDDAFLKEIEGWRDELAKNIARRNDLTARDLNYAVQKTIDRIVFLRICEARGLETYGRLQSLCAGPAIYSRLTELFENADDKYNSGLFHFHTEKGRGEAADEWTLKLVIDDKPLKEIIKHLYYPDSPYEFSVLPADILGQVYERFLGKVIRLTAGGQAKVEEKPEVRKAGGVYYTPTYVVDYIVRQTVGTLLADRTLKTFKTKPPELDCPLRVLDPACGSGSFLLGAYQFLLDWHLTQYIAAGPETLAKGAAPPIRSDGRGGWRLTTGERKRILLAHIYGVDIDAQAVEVTKLSLLLKVLEGETGETLQPELFARRRALPDLAHNIKCGNSLIGPDFYDGTQRALFDEEQQLRINAFDWKREFKDAMTAGGFDAVIGNPPYTSFSGRQAVTLTADEQAYYATHYLNDGWLTTHGLFIEHAVRLLSARCVGFIVPDQVGHLDGYRPVREAVARHSRLAGVRYWGEHVFRGVVTPALSFVADRHSQDTVLIHSLDGSSESFCGEPGAAWSTATALDFLARILDRCGSLGKLVADPGVHTGNCSKKLVLDPADAPDGGGSCARRQADRSVCVRCAAEGVTPRLPPPSRRVLHGAARREVPPRAVCGSPNRGVSDCRPPQPGRLFPQFAARAVSAH